MCWGVAAGGCEPPDARTKLFLRAASALDHFSCFNNSVGADLVQDTGLMDSTPTAL